MRIHLLSAFANRTGGADVYTEQLAVGLAERGHRVTVICQGASDRVRECCDTVVATLPDYDTWPALWRAAPLLRWRFWQRFVAGAPLDKPDAVICSKSVAMRSLASRFPQTPRVYLPHWRIEPVEIETMLPAGGSLIQRQLACRVASRCERWSLLNATTTVRFTHGNVDDLRLHYRLPSQVRFDVIPAGVVGPAAWLQQHGEQPLRLLSVGRLVETKNLRFLLECLAKLASKSWQLDLVGEGPERDSLQRLVAERGLSSHVHFHGHCDDIEPFYRRADLHVFPSRLESLGLVVLEAMSHGVPTLAIRADGQRYRNANHELITPNVDGVLAEDERDFARHLSECIDRPEVLASLRAQARHTYVTRHTWNIVLDRWEELLGQLVRRGQGNRTAVVKRRRPLLATSTAAVTA